MRQAPRRDANEKDIVDALRELGASVQYLSSRGVPDLLVGWRNENFLLEIKMPGEGLNNDQTRWHLEWRGRPPSIVRSIADAFHAIGATWAAPPALRDRACSVAAGAPALESDLDD